MISTAPISSEVLLATSFAYVDSDLADGQTLADWRRERHVRPARPARRSARIIRRFAARWAP